MTTQDLIKSLREKDLEAFNQFYEKYGWELHNYLRERCPDKEMASEVFRRTMSGFCNDLSASNGADMLEVMLCMYADNVCKDMERQVNVAVDVQLKAAPELAFAVKPEQESESVPEVPPVLQAENLFSASAPIAPETRPVFTQDWSDLSAEPVDSMEMSDPVMPQNPGEKRSFLKTLGFVFAVILLVVGVLAAVWVVLGLVMDANLIPGFQFDLGYSWFNQNIAPWF